MLENRDGITCIHETLQEMVYKRMHSEVVHMQHWGLVHLQLHVHTCTCSYYIELCVIMTAISFPTI